MDVSSSVVEENILRGLQVDWPSIPMLQNAL